MRVRTVHCAAASRRGRRNSQRVSDAIGGELRLDGRSTADFIVILEGASGSGQGTVRARVDPNAGVSRSGTLVAGGLATTVLQSGPIATVIDVTAGFTGTDNWIGQSFTVPGSGAINFTRFNFYNSLARPIRTGDALHPESRISRRAAGPRSNDAWFRGEVAVERRRRVSIRRRRDLDSRNAVLGVLARPAPTGGQFSSVHVRKWRCLHRELRHPELSQSSSERERRRRRARRIHRLEFPAEGQPLLVDGVRNGTGPKRNAEAAEIAECECHSRFSAFLRARRSTKRAGYSRSRGTGYPGRIAS